MDVDELLRSTDLPEVAVRTEDALAATVLRGRAGRRRRTTAARHVHRARGRRSRCRRPGARRWRRSRPGRDRAHGIDRVDPLRRKGRVADPGAR